MEMMKALVVEEQGRIALQQVPIPEPGPDEVLCRVAYNGVCGTDLVIYTGETSFVRDGLIKYPVRIGHEWSGTVVRCGSAVKDFAPGDRVVADNGVSCRDCPDCRDGRYGDCKNGKSVGTINCWDGSYAEYMLMPECHLYHLPDSIPLRLAATVEPLTVAYGGIICYDIKPETVVAVIGTGPIGMSAVALAHTAGAGKVICIGRTPFKLETARKLGADAVINNTVQDTVAEIAALTDGHGADFVIETSGAVTAVQEAIDIAAKHGYLSMIGFYEAPVNDLIFNRLVSKELTVRGIMGKFGLPRDIIRYMTETGLDLGPMITSEISLDEAVSYFENHTSTRKRDVKVMVRISGEE